MSRAQDAPAGRRKVPRAEREAEMVDVAMRLFAERGFHAVSVDEVAAGAGVTKPMVYAYFGSKDGLFEACVSRAADGLVGALERSAALHQDPERRMFEGLLTVFRFVDEHRGAWALLYGGTANPLTASASRSSAAMARLLTDQFEDTSRSQGVAAAATATHVEPLAHAFVASTIGLARWWVEHPGEALELQVLRLMNMHWHGFERMMRGDLWLPPPPGTREETT